VLVSLFERGGGKPRRNEGQKENGGLLTERAFENLNDVRIEREREESSLLLQGREWEEGSFSGSFSLITLRKRTRGVEGKYREKLCPA